MKKYITQTMMITTMMIGTLLVLSTSNWMSMWLGMEINMMAFIPLLFKNNMLNSSESMMIYFLTQAMASTILLASFTMLYLLNQKSMIPTIIMSMSLMIKIGMPPFHSWFPEIMKKMSWQNCAILMTWQKIAPLIIMNNIIKTTYYMPLMIITATMIGSLGGVNQTSMQKIMAYSSISHLSWMCMMMMINNQWMLYLIIYSSMVIMMTIMFYKQSIFSINSMTTNVKTNTEKITLISLIMSLGGLPPFLGFIPKWLAMQNMMSSKMIMCMLLMVLMNLITLFFYMRMMSTTMVINSINTKWTSKKHYIPWYSMIILVSNTMPLMYILTF